MTQRRVCSSCGYDGLHQFLDLGLSPIADAYVDKPDAPVDMYPLQVAVCTGCRLVQLLEVVDARTLFGTGYSFYSSASWPLSRYHERYAAGVLSRYGDGNFVVEVGCNDGDMLRHFAREKTRHLGVDPASGPVAKARERGLDVIEAEFTARLAFEIRDEHGTADIIIANHVLAHVEDVASVLSGISRLLADDGVALIEVQYLPDLLTNNAFDLVYHEHRNFFSFTSLENAARRWGLRVVDASLTPRQGGSLRITLRHAVHSNFTSSYVDVLRSSEWWLNSGLGAYDGMQGRVERVRTRLLDCLHDAAGEIAGYGAPAKATTLLNVCGITSDDLDYVTDTTPAKQGRYIPGTGLQILAPDEGGIARTQLLLAWNYAHEIIKSHRKFDVKWIIPIPAPVVI